MTPAGMPFAFASPAPFGSDIVPGGRLNTTQCHQPLPVGASGSYIVTAKLLVALGAPLQFNAGEILPPVQPKPLKTCSLAIVAPSFIWGLVRVMLCACAAPAAAMPAASAPARITGFAICSPRSRRVRIVQLARDEQSPPVHFRGTYGIMAETEGFEPS